MQKRFNVEWYGTEHKQYSSFPGLAYNDIILKKIQTFLANHFSRIPYFMISLLCKSRKRIDKDNQKNVCDN